MTAPGGDEVDRVQVLHEAATAGRARGGSRRQTRVLIGVLVVLAAAMVAGDGLSPALLVHAPLFLVALSPRARNVVLVSQIVGPVPLVTVALLRRLAGIPVAYRLGQLHGDDLLDWLDRRLPRTGGWTRRIERWFHRAAKPVVLIIPGPMVAYLAGSTAMPLPALLGLCVVGVLVRLLLLLALGDLLAGVLTSLVAFVGAHQGQALALTLSITAVQLLLLQRRRAQRRSAAAPVAAADVSAAADHNAVETVLRGVAVPFSPSAVEPVEDARPGG
jgi:membrane protein DedA with SNARE-associated domain